MIAASISFSLMGQAPCRRPPKVISGESILETGSSRLENCVCRRVVFGWKSDPKSVLGGSLGGLGRLLGSLWEAFGAWVVSWRLWGCLWIDFWRLLDGFGSQKGVNVDPKSKKKRSKILIGFWYRFLTFFLIVFWGSGPWVCTCFSHIILKFACLEIWSKIASKIDEQLPKSTQKP